jgi:hypothetical protein
VTHSDFADTTYFVGTDSQAVNFAPVFFGADNSQCPQTVTLSLRLEGQGNNWVDWSGGVFIIAGTTYSFITSFTASGDMADLGKFTIEETA